MNTGVAEPPTYFAGSSQRRAAALYQGDSDALLRPEFADYLLDIAASYPEADTIHLVMDNLSTHTRRALVERFGEKAGGWLWKRFTAHYTPKHGSWLNQAEIEVGLLSRQCLGKRRKSETSLACASKLGPGLVA